MKKTVWIVRTAICLALLIAVQFFTRSFGQLATGSCVNLVLAVSALIGGVWSGITVAVISPFCAYLLGIGPAFLPMVPCVSLGNAVYALLFGLFVGKYLKEKKPAAAYVSMALAAAAAVASRLMLYALAYAFYRKGGGADSFADSFEALWTHWDVRHYLGIARDGYTNVGDARLRLVFFPLYPAVTRVFSAFTGGNLFAAGTLVSLLCSGLCAALLYDLAAMHLGGRGARLAVAYFLLSPMSVFLACAYTEALFISLTLAAVCLLRRGHPWGAALCGMASALTRMPGVIVSGLFIIAFLARIPREGLRMKAVLRCLAQVGMVFGGLFIYWGINWLVTGDPMTYLIYQKENWYQQPGSFWASTANTVSYLISTCGDDDWLFTWGFQLLAMGYIYILLAARQKKLPFDLAAYSFVYVAVVLSPTWLLSGARYLYALATLPLLQAQSLKSRAAHAVGLSVCAALLVVFTWGYTIAAAVL